MNFTYIATNFCDVHDLLFRRKHLVAFFLHWSSDSQNISFVLANDTCRSILLQQGKLLGRVRVEVAKTLSTAGYPIYDNEDPCFLWVHEFPLFLPTDETGVKEGADRAGSEAEEQKWTSCHHPFTAPRESDRGLVYTEPGKVIGEHFDLVLNGEEVGGGSIRINDAALQKYVLCSVLGLADAADKMSYFFDALESGCPPHGGIALGLDRLMALISPYAQSIRDVIAFPKSSDCRDLMTGAPCELDQRTRSLYHLADESREQRSQGETNAKAYDSE